MRRFAVARTAALAAILVAAMIRGACASTTTVYGSNLNAIYTINTSTGAATAISNFTSAPKTAPSLAARPSDGVLFFLSYDSSTNTTTVYRWNPATPSTAPLTLGTTGIVAYLQRLAFGPDGKLYAMDQSSTEIYVLNQTTGAASPNGSVNGIGSAGGDMAFGPTGTLYVMDANTLYTIAATGGAATTLGTVSVGSKSTPTGIAFDGAGRLLVATDDKDANIYAVTLPSLSSTNLGIAGSAIRLNDMASIVASDLAITASHTGYLTAQGPSGSYTLQPKNTGNGQTSGTITLTDTLPAGLSYVSASGTGWSCAASGQVVTCTSSSTIAPNANGNAITLNVTASTSAIPSVTNTVTIAGGNEPALFAGDDSASDFTYVGGLSIIKSVDVSQPHPGDTVTYTLTYSNNNPPSGGATLRSIVISDAVPSHMTFWSASCSGLPAALTACSVSGPAVGGTGTVSWTLSGTLNVGGSGAVILKVKVQ